VLSDARFSLLLSCKFNHFDSTGFPSSIESQPRQQTIARRVDESIDERMTDGSRAGFTISRKNPDVLFLLLDALRRHDGNDDGGRRRREAPRLRSCTPSRIVRSLTQARESAFDNVQLLQTVRPRLLYMIISAKWTSGRKTAQERGARR